MAQIHVGQKDIDLDLEGFLTHPEDWDENVAEAIARLEGVGHLDRERLDIIHFLRDYHIKNQNFPILRYVCKQVHASSRNCVTEQFTNPIVAWKIAGLPKPPNVFFTTFDGKNYFANPFY